MPRTTESPPHLWNVDAVPTGDRYAYHVTRNEQREAICTEGLDRERRKEWGRHVDGILHEYDDDFEDIPTNRSRCVFLYPEADHPLSVPQESPLNVCFVIDLQRISADFYTADWEIASKLYGGPGADQDIAHDYWETCRPYTIGDTTESELLVAGDIPPTALTHVFDP